MKAIILSGIAAVAIASSAFAADLAPHPAAVAPAPVAPTWTGFYLGGNIGGVVENASGTSDFTDTIPEDPSTTRRVTRFQTPDSWAASRPATIGNSRRYGSQALKLTGIGRTPGTTSAVKLILIALRASPTA